MSMFGRSSSTTVLLDLLTKTRHTRAEAYTSSLASRWSRTVVIAMHWTDADHSGNALRVDCPVKFLFGETLLQLCGLAISLPSQAAGQRKLVAICLSEESRYAQTKQYFLCDGETVHNVADGDDVRAHLQRPGARPLSVVYDHAGKLVSTDRDNLASTQGADAQCEQQKSTSPKRANVDGSG
ncbi:unnamed protein product (mitochondrion) [Plasmodiophora brassicae]|uniref:Uncharacterized protein n=2 Tax=Plasmodiophora brassicae TaxID=37360 RepID=A0A3P3YDF8_PLABS|nr:unnamed protein product [Plasmodiophora brassicae]